MDSLIAALVLFAAAPTPKKSVPAWIVLEDATVEVPGAPVETGWQRTEIAPDRVRRSASSKSEVVVLDVEASDALRVFDADAQTYFSYSQTTIATGDMASPFFAAALDEQGRPTSAPPFRKTGRREAIGDWMAAEWISRPGPGGEVTALWLADRPSGMPNRALADVEARIFSRPGSEWTPYVTALEALPGFPVRTVITWPSGDGVACVTLTVTAIQRSDVPDSDFEIPDGSRRIADPLGVNPR